MRPARLPRPFLLLVATLFAAVTVLASLVWMRAVRAQAAAAIDTGRWAPVVEPIARQVHDLYPLPFVIVGLAVLFLRIEDRNAWLLALLFSCFVATPGLPNRYAQVEPALRAFGFVHAALSLGLIGPLFYFFFAVFPARSPLDQRWPWLKWAALATGVTLAVPGIPEGGLRLPAVIAAADAPISSQVPVVFVLGCFGLGFAALVASYRGTPDPEARRKSRVIFWGTLAGVLPALASVALDTFTRYRSPAALSLFVPCSSSPCRCRSRTPS